MQCGAGQRADNRENARQRAGRKKACAIDGLHFLHAGEIGRRFFRCHQAIESAQIIGEQRKPKRGARCRGEPGRREARERGKIEGGERARQPRYRANDGGERQKHNGKPVQLRRGVTGMGRIDRQREGDCREKRQAIGGESERDFGRWPDDPRQKDCAKSHHSKGHGFGAEPYP